MSLLKNEFKELGGNMAAFLCIFFLLFSTVNAFALDDIQTLNDKLQNTAEETERASLYKEIGDYHASLDNYSQASDAYLKALPFIRNGLTVNEHLQIAKYLSWGKKYNEAIFELNSIVQTDPSNCEAQLHLSRVLSWTQQTDQAIASYDHALRVCGNLDKRAEIYKEIGELYISRNDIKNAVKTFSQALSTPEIFPVEDRLKMAQYISDGGDKETAIQVLNKILGSDPGNKKARTLLVKEILSFKGTQGIEEIKKISQRPEEQASLYKEIGDYFVSQGDYKSAVHYYIPALQMGRKQLSTEERIQIAKYLSWGGNPREATNELRVILQEDSANQKARLQLARILSWDGKFSEAMRETDSVLKESPGNEEALVIKANALRWWGDTRRAIPIYKNVLNKGEDFDSRLGLAYSYLLMGHLTNTEYHKEYLKPVHQYQQGEMDTFNEEFFRMSRPNIEAGYSFYKDTDDNEVNRYTSGVNFWLANWRNGMHYAYIDAKDDHGRATYAHDISFNTNSRISDIFSIGGRIGLYLTGTNDNSQYITWQVKSEADILNGNIGVRISRDGLPVTAELIENGICVTSTLIYIQQRFTDRFSAYGSYTYRDYSDDNNANDFFISTNYLLYRMNPRIHMGYRFRYMDFNRQSSGGYFDPDDFMSHQIYGTISFTKGRFYGYLEPFIGYESYRRDEDQTDDIVGGGYGHIGFRLTKRFALEINGEGGNYAGTAAGWNYYQFGLRAIVLL
jgi:tetratricopeptide (TPR) repeat protein